MSATSTKSRVVSHSGSKATPGWQVHGASVLLVFGVWIAYANSLSAPFIFDDIAGIVHNESIRQLWPIWDALWAPSMATGATGRPMVNLSLALNYAVGGLDVQSYHIFNTLLHSLAALTLFGLLRRSLLSPMMPEQFIRSSLSLSFVMAALWSLHPLLTESVTCVIQRTELLGSLFYLLTLYTFVRSLESNAVRWQTLSVLACLVGMASKEIMVTAPVIVLLYDRTFVTGDFKKAWSMRWRYYYALSLTWVLLGFLVFSSENRSGVAGLGLGVSAWDYALTQCRGIILYIKLALWPHPLLVDYGAGVIQKASEVWWQGILLLALVAGTFVALVRKPKIGFLAFTFFSILAPSSSFIPLITQTIAEHRMYLPLAAIVVLVIGGLHYRWPKWTVPAALGLALLATVGTIRRNQDYRSELSLWEDTVEKFPDNARARLNLGGCYARVGRLDEAIAEFQAGIRVKPGYAEAEFCLGNAFAEQERFDTAVKHYQQAVGFRPDYAEAHYALANALVRTGKMDEALEHYQNACRLDPNRADPLHSYASTLMFIGRYDESLARYNEVLRITPNDPALHSEVGQLLSRMSKPEKALHHLEQAVRLAPGNTGTYYTMATVLWQLGRFSASEVQLKLVIRAQPNNAEAYNSLGMVLMAQEKWREAADSFAMALRLEPGFSEAQTNLDQAELLRDLRGG